MYIYLLTYLLVELMAVTDERVCLKYMKDWKEM